MTFKYGEFTKEQMHEAKFYMRKRIFFLLLIVDKETAYNYKEVDVEKTFDNLLTEFGGLNDLLDNPPELVSVLSLLEAARLEYEKSDFSWHKYRKLILDAGCVVDKIKEV